MVAMHFHFQHINKPCIKVITIMLFLIPLTATSLSFNYTSFTSNDPDIIYEGSAGLDNNHIQLTPYLHERVGRATYAQPLHLWDRNSGNLTDFATNFTFVINSFNSTEYGDGFTFFLAPNNSRFPQNATGGSLGLTYLVWNSTNIHHVAVEFDIYSNPDVDPPYKHVGIDINAMSSVANVSWWSDISIMQGMLQEAWISYDSQSRNLTVIFTGFTNTTLITQRLSYIVDLREYLPEFVTFGFTAATGGEGSAALQNVYSWSFNSNLGETVSRTITPNNSDPNETYPPPKPPSSRAGLSTGAIAGIATGAVLLAIIMAAYLYFVCCKERRTDDAVDNSSSQEENRFIEAQGGF